MNFRSGSQLSNRWNQRVWRRSVMSDPVVFSSILSRWSTSHCAGLRLVLEESS